MIANILLFLFYSIPISLFQNVDAPRIHCENATAYRNERNVSISCIVASRPRVDPDQLRWVLERGAGDFNVMKSTAYWKQNVVSVQLPWIMLLLS